MTVQELIAQLARYEPTLKVVFVAVDCDTPSIDSFTIDEIKKQHGFVQLVSIDHS